MPRLIFVPARGQYDNIGDILLRRQLLDWVRRSGPLHVFVGQSPPGYDDGLGLRAEDTVYRSFGRWYLAALRSAIAGRASYVFKPGEIQLTLLGMKEHLSMLPVITAVRARGGAVARIGVGSRNFSRMPRLLIRPSIALSSISLWRDQPTAEYLGGELMPDLGFGEGATDTHDVPRDAMVVSMRADRPYPSRAWISAVRQSAAERDLEVWTVTQVFRDRERSLRLAADLGGRVLDWDGTDHHLQEERLRALYRRSLFAISDRLHVLIAAVTEGATPIAALVDRSDKIRRHFASAGFDGVALATEGLSSEQIRAFIDGAVDGRASMVGSLDGARAALSTSRARVDLVLGSR